jgi:hypothetical protein
MRALVIRSALLFIFLIIASIRFPSAVVAHIADGVPTLAPIVREVTPTVVNISVRGRIKEENPLYRDPLFRLNQILCVDSSRLVSEFEIPLMSRTRCSA